MEVQPYNSVLSKTSQAKCHDNTETKSPQPNKPHYDEYVKALDDMGITLSDAEKINLESELNSDPS